MGLQLVVGSTSVFAQEGQNELAFLADIHLQDVYTKLNSEQFQGVFNPKSGKYATIRTMKSQLNSTRLFNENYFALISALEDIKKRGIKLVVLPGDFTDDGQPMNVLALKKILANYARETGMRFFITTGNHDPVQPFGGLAGKRDFLGTNGSNQAIAGDSTYFPSVHTVLSDQINYWGYAEISRELADYGFFPIKHDLFWTHPFESLDYENYRFEHTRDSSRLENRVYAVGNTGLFLPDLSYLVEPVEGIWLMALDGNVYSLSGEEWKGSSIGFNQAISHKKHQLDWIRKVSAEAKKRGKKLISFSHYPLVEFHDGASEMMVSLFGKNKFQLARVPSAGTSKEYADAGIQIHFAGHMHINDTGTFRDTSGIGTLHNIQVPSLAAFPPAYKTLKFTHSPILEIQTIQLEEVDGMDEFFDLYRMEHRWLTQREDPKIWDSTILTSKDYLEYTRNHLLELTKSRFLPSDWPKDLLRLLIEMDQEDVKTWIKLENAFAEAFLQNQLNNSTLSDFSAASIPDLLNDFYLIKNGDELGKKLIPADRTRFYNEVFARVEDKKPDSSMKLSHDLSLFFKIFSRLYHSQPSSHFSIDLTTNELVNLSQN